MKIRVLGCHGSDLLWERGGASSRCQSVGFLINDVVMIDAGTGACELTLEEQKRIQHVALSHLHLDHIKGLPALADNLVGLFAEPITIASIPAVLHGLKEHVFNDQVFPDFFSLPNPDQPILKEIVLQEGHETWLSGLGITPIAVNHPVPTVGFLIRDDESCWLYSGDTYKTFAIWERAARQPNLKAAFIETSFPDEMKDLAYTSKHLTPQLLAEEFEKLGKPDLPLFIYHCKPQFREQIAEQLGKLRIPNLKILEEGQEFEI